MIRLYGLTQLIALIIAVIPGIQPLWSQQNSSAQLPAEMQAEINEIRTEIANLEAELKAATDPDEISDLKEQIAQLNQTLSLLNSASSK
ncbi:MAG: hypothetical protein R3B93_25340 [Bacteroidia bacterium]